MNILNETFAKYGLIVSGEKTEYIVSNEECKEETVTLRDGKKLKRVNEFVYLVSVFTSDCKCDQTKSVGSN